LLDAGAATRHTQKKRRRKRDSQFCASSPDIADKHRGSQAELMGSAWLFGQGFEVFRNLSQHGIADLIALDPSTGSCMLIDVKSEAVGRSAGGARKLTKEQKRIGVRRLLVDRKTGICRWDREPAVDV